MELPPIMSAVDPEFQSDIATLRRILSEVHVVAVVGLSRNWHRPSNFAAKYLHFLIIRKFKISYISIFYNLFFFTS